MGWEIRQMDVKTTFLNGVIEEEVYIEQPEGFETHEKKSHVCRLKKALYGLKQAPRACCRERAANLSIVWDDLYLTGSSRLIGDREKNLATEFDMKDLGRTHYFLGLEVWQQKREIFLGQGRYATKVLKRFGMEDCRPMAMPMITNWKKIDASKDKDVDPTIYRQLIGFLMYLVNTKPDIFYTVNTLSSWWNRRGRTGQQPNMFSDWAGSSVDQKSTFGYCFNIGSGMISWCSRTQKSVALSSSEAEYMVASTNSCEAIWHIKLLVNLFKRNMEATKIMCDNQSCIKHSENLVFHDRSKHIDIRCHFVRDCVQRGAVQLGYTPTGEQVANILTKALGRTKFDYFREKMGMVKNPFQW
eukprot:PITA_01703